MLSLNDSMILVSGAFDLFPDAIIVVDKEGIIKNTNKQVAAVFGYSEAELRGAELSILLPERYRGNHGNFVAGFLQHTEIRKMGSGVSLFGLHKSGKEINIDIALSAIALGERRYALAVVRDITDKVSIISRLHQTEKIKEELEKFAYILTHDLKAPLSRIRTLSELLHLELSDKENDDIQAMLSYLLQSVDGMEGLIYGVLNYYKAKLSNSSVPESDINLDDILDRSLKMVNIPTTFTVVAPQSLPHIMADETMILQIFNNLIANAITYNNKPQGILEIACTAAGGTHIFSFADNGTPIPDGQKATIFEVTTQLQNKNTGNHGLGLAIIQQLITARGGQIWCEDSAQGGCCFKFTWPQRRAEES